MTDSRLHELTLARLAARWRRGRMAAAAILLVLTLAPLEVLLVVWAGAPSWWLPVGALAALSVGWLALRRRPTAQALARHLDRTVPALEESTELLLADAESLAPLARLQQGRVRAALAGQEVEAVPFDTLPSRSLWKLTLGALAVSVAIWVAGPVTGEPEVRAGAGDPADANPRLAFALTAEITPPDYTGLEPRLETVLEGSLETPADLSVVEGSAVTWRLSGLPSGAEASLVFDDLELRLTERPDAAGVEAGRSLGSSRLYFLSVTQPGAAPERSGYARLEVTPDRPPEIRITRPEPFVLLPETGSDRLVVTAEISDEYSVETTSLVATVASGTGELVEFRERRFGFPRRDGNARNGSHARVFDLADLGVTPGAELYFHVEASDNRAPHPGRSRSATHVVRRAGGAAASVGLGGGIPVFAVPDLFRSQRQIILDTERLLAGESAMSEVEFQRRSQEIGFDQRALRMRYGVLLGQEFVDGQPLTEEEEALEFEEDEDLGELVGELPEGLVHQHDPQDLNTFFDSAVRERMRAALREMWGAEGLLRSNDPAPALPYEYRALTLLKQAQERSRVYVQKVGFEAPPLFPDEKRLTGDLAEVRSRMVARRARIEGSPKIDSILDGLAGVASGDFDGAEAASVVRAARRELLEGALRQSSSDLEALEAAAGLETALEAGEPADPERLRLVVEEIWKRLPEPGLRPGRSPVRWSQLFGTYLEELTRVTGGSGARGR